jgi:hypothetical protein
MTMVCFTRSATSSSSLLVHPLQLVLSFTILVCSASRLGIGSEYRSDRGIVPLCCCIQPSFAQYQ